MLAVDDDAKDGEDEPLETTEAPLMGSLNAPDEGDAFDGGAPAPPLRRKATALAACAALAISATAIALAVMLPLEQRKYTKTHCPTADDLAPIVAQVKTLVSTVGVDYACAQTAGAHAARCADYRDRAEPALRALEAQWCANASAAAAHNRTCGLLLDRGFDVLDAVKADCAAEPDRCGLYADVLRAAVAEACASRARADGKGELAAACALLGDAVSPFDTVQAYCGTDGCDLLAPVLRNTSAPLAALCNASAGRHAAACGALAAVRRDVVDLACELDQSHFPFPPPYNATSVTEAACAVARFVFEHPGDGWAAVSAHCACADLRFQDPSWGPCERRHAVCDAVGTFARDVACANRSAVCDAVVRWENDTVATIEALRALEREACERGVCDEVPDLMDAVAAAFDAECGGDAPSARCARVAADVQAFCHADPLVCGALALVDDFSVEKLEAGLAQTWHVAKGACGAPRDDDDDLYDDGIAPLLDDDLAGEICQVVVASSAVVDACVSDDDAPPPAREGSGRSPGAILQLARQQAAAERRGS